MSVTEQHLFYVQGVGKYGIAALFVRYDQNYKFDKQLSFDLASSHLRRDVSVDHLEEVRVIHLTV